MISKLTRWLAVPACALALGAHAATPKNTFVMAKDMSDIITLDPAEVFELTTGEVIAPAQIVSLPGVVEGDAEGTDAVLLWVHPDAVDDCEASLSNAGASVTRVRSLCRLELTGETARSSLSASSAPRASPPPRTSWRCPRWATPSRRAPSPPS